MWIILEKNGYSNLAHEFARLLESIDEEIKSRPSIPVQLGKL